MGKRAMVVYAKFVMVLVTFALAVLTLYSLTGGNKAPIGHTFHACLVTVLPIFIVLNILIFFYWALLRRRWRWSLLALFPLCFCWNYVQTIYQFRSLPDSVGHDNVLTVATYNVRMFSNEGSGVIANDILQTFRREGCDVVCMQEYRDELPAVNSTVHAKMRSIYPYSAVGKGNMAIFSRYPIVGEHNEQFEDSNNGWQWADIELGKGLVVRVFNVHMETTGINSALRQMAKENDALQWDEDTPINPEEAEAAGEQRNMFNSRINNDRIYHLLLGNYAFGLSVRAGQSAIVANAMRTSDKPVLLAGDFNDVPYSYTYKTLRGDLVDGFTTGGSGLASTFRGAHGVFRIDYIFADKRFPCFKYQTHDLTYSDHNPVIAKFDLK